MIDLTKVRMPSAVEVEGVFFDVKTDFQYWILFQQLLKQEEVLLSEFDFLYTMDDNLVLLAPEDRQKGLDALTAFCFKRNELPRVNGKATGPRTIDFILDSDLIYASFYEQYGIDLCDPTLHLHWYKFLALLNGIHDTKLSEVIGYRLWKKNDKRKYENQMEELRSSWELPIPATKEEKKALDEFNSLFN